MLGVGPSLLSQLPCYITGVGGGGHVISQTTGTQGTGWSAQYSGHWPRQDHLTGS